jgi:hypothetical protein
VTSASTTAIQYSKGKHTDFKGKDIPKFRKTLHQVLFNSFYGQDIQDDKEEEKEQQAFSTLYSLWSVNMDRFF